LESQVLRIVPAVLHHGVELPHEGTDNLIIEDIYCENGAFTSDFEDELVLAPAKGEFSLAFNVPAEDDGDYNADMIILSNDRICGTAHPASRRSFDPPVSRSTEEIEECYLAARW
jgi:hypothetical protein